MDTKYRSACAKTLPITSFRKNASAALGSKVFALGFPCREAQARASKKKRKALRQLGPENPLIPPETSIPAYYWTTEAAFRPVYRSVLLYLKCHWLGYHVISACRSSACALISNSPMCGISTRIPNDWKRKTLSWGNTTGVCPRERRSMFILLSTHFAVKFTRT